MKIDCLIVEDEPVAQKGLSEFIENIAFLRLKGCCDDALDAIKYLETEKVDLIFLDIHMPRLNGLNFLRTLISPPQIILTTAYPDYALQGYEYDVADYLVKPIPFERFVKAVNKVRAQIELKNPTLNDDFIFIKANKKLEKISFCDLLYVEALSHYIILHTARKKYITYVSLKNIEQKLPSRFLKVHKSYLINFDKIESIESNGIVINGKQVPVSRIYKENIDGMVKNKIVKRET